MKNLHTITTFSLILFVIHAFFFSELVASKERLKTEPLALNAAKQITSEADPVFYFAVSKDGKWLVYTSGRAEFTDLWQRSADPSVVILPEQLTSEPTSESAPTISSDGRYVAFVGAANDVKGDIYVIDREAKTKEPKRLTDRDTEDGMPCFSPVGSALYFHQKKAGQLNRQVASIDFASGQGAVKTLDTGIDASFPAIAPDGKKIAFTSFSQDKNGDIFVMDLPSGKPRQVTSGESVDVFPAWSSDGDYLYFSRIFIDTNQDGQLTFDDRAAIFRANMKSPQPRAYPVTSYAYSSIQPKINGDKLYFLSSKRGTSNVWALPLDGEIPRQNSAQSQFQFAQAIETTAPPSPQKTLLAYYKVVELFSSDQRLASDALLKVGRLYLQLDMSRAAESVFHSIYTDYPQAQPTAGLAQIEKAFISAELIGKDADTSWEKDDAVKKGLTELASISAQHSRYPKIQALSLVRQARLKLTFETDPKTILQAIDLTDKVLNQYASEKSIAAEAAFYKATIYQKAGMTQNVYPAYIAVIDHYPTEEDWTDKAIDSVLNLATDAPDLSTDEKVAILQKIVEENRTIRPDLALGALNRIGDTYYALNERSRAKAVYQQALQEFPKNLTQYAASKLALAEILYQEERFRQAIDLYQSEITDRTSEDHIYYLARAGYIRKSIEAGEFYFSAGEVPAARALFKELILFDDAIVEAHRGYIKCAAAENNLQPTLEAYQKRLKANHNDDVALYAVGLALTYLETKDGMEEARPLIEKAIQINGSVEYYYQTLGYILENLQTAYHEEGTLLLALEAYQKAYFLNDHISNALNAAHLQLNIGNCFYYLKDYKKAFQHYAIRFNADKPFEDDMREILFYIRFGGAAFQIKEPSMTIEAYEKAVALIQDRVNPKKASDAFDQLIRYNTDRILTPASKLPKLETKAKDLAKRQSKLNGKLAILTQSTIPLPPDPEWNLYKIGVEALVEKQKDLNKETLDIAESLDEFKDSIDETEKQIAFMTKRITDSLQYPVRLLQLKVEMLDRLALAYQEDGQWKKSMETFETVYELNERLGFTHNLVRSKRSAAYNAYMEAGLTGGQGRRELLEKSAQMFNETLALIKRYGVTSKKKEEKKEALIDVSLEIALNEVKASEATFGFSDIQETRLAESFISRINTELGQPGAAYEQIQTQLSRYPAQQTIADKDLYGVSLLFHRAGHLSAVQSNLSQAFDNFKESAQLALKMEQGVSASLNVGNMAAILIQMPPDSPEFKKAEPQLYALDSDVAHFFKNHPSAGASLAAADYYNTMGVYLLKLPVHSSNPIETEVKRMKALQLASSRFMMALESLEKSVALPGASERTRRFQLAVAYLNMAEVASGLSNDDKAREYLAKALELSETGLFPELKWRALARLGRYDEALTALESVTVVRANARPLEVMTLFSPMILQKVAEGKHNPQKIEEAFELTERLSELERLNVIAPLMIGAIPLKEQKLYKSLYRQLLTIDELAKQLPETQSQEPQTQEPQTQEPQTQEPQPQESKSQKPLTPEQQQIEALKERIEKEQEILTLKLGESRENLPSLALISEDKTAQDKIILLIGLALEAEDKAEAFSNKGAKDVKGDYDRLIDSYRGVQRDFAASHNSLTQNDVSAFFAPNPVKAKEAIAALSKDDAMVRLVRVWKPEEAFILFRLNPGGVQVETLSKQTVANLSASKIHYIAYEDVGALPSLNAVTYALSATHFYRSFNNRKPFKRSLVVLTPEDKPLTVNEAFDSVTLQTSTTPDEIIAAMPEAQTLALNVKVGLFSDAPTRAGQEAKPFPAIELNKGERLPLRLLFGKLYGASLTLLPLVSLNDAYAIGHLFSIYGCPSVIIPTTPSQDPSFLSSFLKTYSNSSSQSALQAASSSAWAQLGFRGMTPQEANAFAQEHFDRYVEQAQAASEAQEFQKALTFYAYALTIAKEVDAYKEYAPQLYQLCYETAYQAGYPEKSLFYAERLAELVAKTEPNSEAHGNALLNLGVIQTLTQQYDKAVATFDESLTILKQLNLGPQEIEAYFNLGVTLEKATDYDKALAQFKSAASMSQSLDQKELLAQQYINIGRIYDMRLSQYAQAKASYAQALSVYRALDMTNETARTLVDIGRCYRLLGNFQEANRHYTEAFEIAKKIQPKDFELESRILIEQANNEWFQGAYQDALNFKNQAYQAATDSQWLLGQEIAFNTSGLIWQTLGDNKRALRELNDALKLAQKLPDREDEIATTYNNLGLVYREMGQYKESLAMFDKALAIDEKLKSRWALAYDLRNKGLTLIKMGQTQEAIGLLEKAVAESNAIGDRVNEAKALLGLAEALTAANQDGKAKDSLNKALGLSKSMILRETQWRALFELAKLELKNKRNREAKALLIQAIDIIETMRADIKIEQLRDGFVINKMEVYETLVTVLVNMGDSTGAFDVAERSRARNFIDLLGNHHILFGNKLYDQSKAIKAKIEEYETLAAQAADDAEKKVYQETLDRANDEYKDLLLKIQLDNPQLASLVSVNPLNERQIRALLEPNVTLLSYYVTADEILTWVVRADKIELVRTPLGRKTLEQSIKNYRRMLQNLEPLEAQSKELYDWVIAPIKPKLSGAQYVGIIPHGLLHYLSFATLSDGNDFFIEQYPLFYLPSGSVFQYTLQRRTPQKQLKVLAVGNPELNNPALALPFAEQEVETIQWNFPEITVLTREKATESWIVKNIQDFGIIHIASHGEFDPINPLFSSLKLKQDLNYDGNLEAVEIFDLKIKADLVMLSACQTGLGKITDGDEVIGLNRSFIYAGTHAIISSLWRVSDISTALLVKYFYRQYARSNKINALRSAMLDVKATYPHPGYWGAFALVGDYQ